MKIRLSLIVITAITIPLSFIEAPYPSELVLQHIPTVVGLILLTVAVTLTGLTRLSFACAIAFLWLHIIGARWIYSYVPYDELISNLTGTSLSDRFGWQRNHYDRLVHTASGLLGMPIASEILQRCCRMRPLAAAIMGITCVLAVGALYEVLEWQIAMSVPAAQAEAYNGQQGDVWDPQKDMALAGLGAIVSAGFLFRWSPKISQMDRNLEA